MQASYEDRQTGRAIPVRLTFLEQWLVIDREDGRELDRWSWRDVAPIPGDFPDGRLRVGLAADAHAVLVLDDPDALLRCAHATGMPQPAQQQHRVRRELPLAVWLVGAVLSVLLLVEFVIPAMAGMLAPMVPTSWQARIGDQVQTLATALLTRKGGNDRCDAPDGVAALKKLADRLPPVAGTTRLHIIDSDLPNAFALPGGHVSVTTALMDRADGPEAILGVLAHEMGHLHHGHSMERVMRYGLSSALISMVVGDIGGGALAVGVSQMVESEFSQDQERQADAYAIDALAQARVSPLPLARLFETIRTEHPEADGTLAEWMGSHPTLSERIATLQRAGGGQTAGAVLEAAEWQALKNICQTAAAD
ncbi:hypothetical protein CHU95_04100 [Niveispirillum lacus]|uniref:Peptidase M48 domain-containing protein n=1 Tax=Niveispirillum lacus TaxID=1981099 RepID=A0A255Z4R9_9PROT|nr:M48 family metallopeptidase [Niveispirillum lacus]OYQ36421.1 hypothetical protein CHU95_04100 [Niveispirillum lacus]